LSICTLISYKANRSQWLIERRKKQNFSKFALNKYSPCILMHKDPFLIGKMRRCW
jgi:hypothetical protein